MVKLYVEGGGDSNALRTACREGFSKFITRAGLTKRPRIVACGSRRDAYESFCTAVAGGEDAMLLVDSESAVAADHQVGEPTTWRPWAHLKNRPGDGWDKPAGSSDTDCHLMVQCMEHWLLAHRDQLEAYFGQGFQRNVLPAAAQGIETVTKLWPTARSNLPRGIARRKGSTARGNTLSNCLG